MRLFFAAFFDGDSRRRLSAAARALDLRPESVYQPVEKYHMTLVFMGDVADSKVQGIREIGEAPEIGPISLRFDHWEYWSRARVIVASTSDRPEPLLQLRENLAVGLRRHGVAFDDKSLRPHITVARKLAQAPVLPELSEFACTLRAFSLVVSVTAPTGSVYTVVDTWPLLDTALRG